MSLSLDTLAAEWQEAKRAEEEANAARIKIERDMFSLIGLEETFQGTDTSEAGDYIIKVTGRMNRKVDSDKLQELAAEAGLTDALSSLFRWKPEINTAAWKAADSSITDVLIGAITTTAGKPAFSITKKEQ